MTTPESDDRLDSPTRRLWTPWRMRYVGGGTGEEGCLFCNRLRGDDDVASLILYRAEHSFAIMNLFPYNTGHLMLVPNDHVASPEDAPREALREIADLVPGVVRALRRVLACQGFNVGLNIGSVAGAGIAEHMHQHVVPRWNGDANFMPILGGATVMPELIPVSYAKIRAELSTELDGASSSPCRLVLLDESRTNVFLDPGNILPILPPTSGLPIWRAAVEASSARGARAYVTGWAGSRTAVAESASALTLVIESIAWTDPALGGFVDVGEAADRLPDAESSTLAQAIARLP